MPRWTVESERGTGFVARTPTDLQAHRKGGGSLSERMSGAKPVEVAAGPLARWRPASLALQLQENLKSKLGKLGKVGGGKGVREVSKGGKKEPKSGMSFPGGVCLAGDRSSCVDLAGVGVRRKRLAGIAAITAYAVGVYFDNGDVARQKGGGFGVRRDTPEKLLDGVVANTRKNVIRLVVVFPKATGKMISKSLDDQIGDKVGRARTTVSARSPFEF